MDAVQWRLTMGQKEPELLEKALAQMGSNAPISFSKRRGVAGALYSFSIRNVAVCDDLLKIGLTPRKSLTMAFPCMPENMIRHFIRGCWDGDGSIYLEGGCSHKPCASFVSGSEDFIVQLLGHLVDLGMPHRVIYKTMRSKNPSYYIRWTGDACANLFKLIYDGVDESIYLKRKYDRFKAIAQGVPVYRRK